MQAIFLAIRTNTSNLLLYMNLLFPESIANRSNGTQLIYLFFIIIVCFSLAQLLSLGAFVLSGTDLSTLENTDWSKATDSQVNIYKVAQIISSIFTLLVPAWLYSMAQSGSTRFLQFKQPLLPILVMLTLVTTLVSLPLLGYTMELNQSMQLPKFLAPIEQWMKSTETNLADLTAAFLKMDNLFELILNMVMIAVIPALGEEMLFRGCLQPTLQRYIGNAHVGIWLAAIIFSAIHLQFYGFIPRLLLGALFGYFYLWSGNLWYPVIAHFINNGLQVLMVYVGVVSATDLDTAEQHVPLAAVAVSGLLTVAMLVQYKQNSYKTSNTEQ